MSSNPSAPVKIYLDFDGEAPGTWNTLPVPTTPAYDANGNPSTFDDAELENIRQMWAWVAEKFSPFNVDVTTVNPGTFADKSALRVIVGGNGDWAGTYGGWGGASSTGAFYDGGSNTLYAFSDDYAGAVSWVSNAIVMQVGRAFGLQNQSTYSDSGVKTNQFNPGNSQIAPLMGQPNMSARGMWWNGPSSLIEYDPITKKPVPRMQDDMAVIAGSNNGFGYRADDHGGSVTAATALSSGQGRAGIIETISDADYFSFTTSGGQVSISGNVAPYGAMLNLKLQLFNAAGQQIGVADSATLGETLASNLPAGTYYVAVSGHGMVTCLDSNGVYRGSAHDVGQYSLTLTAPGGGGTAPAAPSNLAVTGGRGVLELTWSDNSSNESGFIVQRSLDGGATWTSVKSLAAGARSWNDNPVATGDVRYRVYATAAGAPQSGYSNIASFTVVPGDANLDGLISADDYSAIDFAVRNPGASGWASGDFNFDGMISADDYSIIDFHLKEQG